MKRAKFNLVFAAVAFLSLSLCSIPGFAAWVPAGLEGQNITALAEDPTEVTTWYAGTATGEIFKFTENGTAWALSSIGLPVGNEILSIAIDPSNAIIVYIASNDGLYKTVDGGLGWFRCDLGNKNMAITDVAIDPYNSTVIFAATSRGIYKSTDSGVNWVKTFNQDCSDVGLNPADFDLAPLPTHTDIIYVSAIGGLYKSVDGGITWNQLATSALGTQSFTGVAVDPEMPSTVYAGAMDAGVFISTDEGLTWAPASNGLGAQYISSLTIYPTNSSIVLAGTAAGGIFRTDSRSSSWYSFNEGIPLADVNATAFILPQGTDYILAGTADGVFSLDITSSDFVVTALSGPASARTNEAFSIASTVATLGGGFAVNPPPNPCLWSSVRLSFYLSLDTNISADDISVGWRDICSMEPGGSSAGIVDPVVPSTMAGGTYYILGSLSTLGLYESDTSNNKFVGSQIEIISPDFVVTALSGPASARTNEAFSIASTVATLGGGFAVNPPPNPCLWSSVRLSFYLSLDTNISADDISVGWRDICSMEPGGSSAGIVDPVVPSTMAGGTYYILGSLSTLGLYESDTSNNKFVGSQIEIY